jgi:hypothetical protein
MRPCLEAALAYARRGWHVFPVHSMRNGRCSCGDADCTSPGKHPRTPRGWKDASTNPGTIVAWWREWFDANVAIATGPSGLAVVDVDPRADGMHSLEALEAVLGAMLPESPVVLTGGNGTHTYMENVHGLDSVGALLPGLDLKAHGGYVIAPTSNHASGGLYRWNPRLGVRRPIPPVPDLLVRFVRDRDRPALIRPPRESRPKPRDLAEALARLPHLRRRYDRDTIGLNDTSASGVDLSIASSLYRQGFSDYDVRDAIERSRAEVGLPAKRASYYASTLRRASGGSW